MTTRTDVGPMAREEISSLPVLPLTPTATRRSDRKGAASDSGELASASENAEKIPGEEEDDSGSIGPSSLVPPPLIIPLRYRLLAFSMIIFFATGSSFAENTLSPLKSTVRKELKVTNAQYGAIASASSLVNTILPIIGGIGMDHWGATHAAIIANAFCLIGVVISALASNTGHYGLMIGGRILMGFGSTIVEQTQNKLYAHWFHGSQIGLVFGIDIAWNRIVGIICKSTAVPMSTINGWWGWALWIPAIACAVNLAICIAYWLFERNVPREYRPVLGRDAYHKEGWARKKFGLKSLLDLPMFFWIFCASQVLQNGAVSSYTSNLADIQTQTRGTSKLAAGYNSSLQGVVPIVLTPVVGYFFDRFGWRMFFVSWTALLYIVVFVLLGLTKVHPLAPILLASFALSSNAITFLCAIPVLVGNDAMLGTAMGVWKSFQNANSVIMDVSAGAIQDRSPTNSYDGLIYFLIAIKAVEVILGPVYDYLDGKWLGHSLRMNEAKRVAFRNRAIEEKLDVKGWRVERKVLLGALGQLSVMIVVAWALYITYSLGT